MNSTAACVILSDPYKAGRKCCLSTPLLQTIDTKRTWQARYEYRVVCGRCGARTTNCTWLPDAKALWDNSDLVKEVERGR